MSDINIDVFLGALKNLITSSNYINLTIDERHQLQSLADEITYLRGFLKIEEKKRNKHMDLVMRIKDIVSEAENIVELYVALVFKANPAFDPLLEHRDHVCLDLKSVMKMIQTLAFKANHASDPLPEHQDHLSLDLECVKEKIQTLMDEVELIYEENMDDQNRVAIKELKHSSAESEDSLGRNNRFKVVERNVVVGFTDEVSQLLGKLSDSGKEREIIQIVGAAGGGKTTLAREVYNHHWTLESFEIRAWVTVSHDYNMTRKRDLLIGILKSASPKIDEDYYTKSNDDILGEKLLKSLINKKYLIVMDDMWGIKAWNDIQRSFPHGHKGSKVVFTSRQPIQLGNIYYVLHFLNPLSESSSWELLRNKVFGEKQCPQSLVKIGKKIAKRCEGLPLAIVAIAGILATNELTLTMWKEISKKTSSIIANHANCMEILELSYNDLPLHLKACFLYIGAHPEDYEFNVRELIWLWIAEGFIQQSEREKSLEAIAEDYLINLTERNLVIVTSKSYRGEIEKCLVHDLWRELCIEKADKDNFIVQLFRDSSSLSTTNNYCRLFIDHQLCHEFSLRSHDAPNLRSFLCFSSPSSLKSFCEHDLSFFVENFKLLRVLNFMALSCPGEIEVGNLVHLRYLAINTEHRHVESCFHFLLNLETFILHDNDMQFSLPPEIFKMVKLRHLYSSKSIFKFHRVSYDENKGNMLDNLHTLVPVCSCQLCLRFLERTPNLRELRLEGWQIERDNVLILPDLEFLKFLENLYVRIYFKKGKTERVARNGLKLPLTLRELTMCETRLKWEEVSIILQKMQNLEDLKLLTNACEGPVWDTTSEEFEEMSSQLTHLKLSYLDIEEWIVNEDQFPRLEVLVMEGCYNLKGIPIEFGDLNELREIRVTDMNKSVTRSAKRILEYHRESFGDDALDLLVVDRYGKATVVVDDDDDGAW